MHIRNAQYGHTTDAQDKEHDEALLKAQLSLLEKVANQDDSNKACRFAESYALISGKLGTTPVEFPKN